VTVESNEGIAHLETCCRPPLNNCHGRISRTKKSTQRCKGVPRAIKLSKTWHPERDANRTDQDGTSIERNRKGGRVLLEKEML